jgi:flagellin
MSNVDVTRIASNIGALNALNSLTSINKKLATHQTAISTGKRINSAADDPAGLTIATKMLARSEGLKTALNNLSDASNMLSVAEAGLSKMNDILVQMRSKAEQAASDTLGSSERSAIQTQLSAYSQQLQDLVDQTKWNGTNLLDQTMGTKYFQTGADAQDQTTWSLTSKLDPASMYLSTGVSQSATSGIVAPATFGNVGATGIQVATSTTNNNQTELNTGGYSFEVLSKATDATNGKAISSGALVSGVQSVAQDTVSQAGSVTELKSGHYRFTVVTATSDTTTTYKIENLDDSSWNTNGQMTVTDDISAGVLLDSTSASVGVKLNFLSDPSVLVAGQTMSFEYIAHNQAKIELNDASGQAVSMTMNGGTGTAIGKFGYATAAAASAFNTGRNVQIQLNTAIGSVTVGSTAAFDYKQANAFSIDVSSSAKAAGYMTTVDSAISKISDEMVNLGSLMARMEFKTDQISTAQINVEASYSRIMNANMAEEQMNASKYTILQQTATAMLAQANTAPQSLLTLFR